jgi:hypothetical protein
MSAVDPSSASDTSTTLQYAPKPPWPRRRRVWVFAVTTILTVAIAGVFAYRYYRPAIAQRRAVMAMHDACLSYSIPRDVEVYGERSVFASQYFNPPKAATTSSKAVPSIPGMVATINDSSLWEWLVPPMLQSQALLRPPGKPVVDIDGGVLFLHGRRSSGRPIRLVCVEIHHNRWRPDMYRESRARHWTFRTRVLRPASFFSAGEILSEQVDSIPNWPDPAFGLQIFGGQPDPQDDSHFTIALAPGSFSGTLDGWLMPDDTVKLAIRPSIAPQAN